MRLTKPQLEELRRLAREPQPTYGSSRVRVQNNLVAKDLAAYIDENGKPNTYERSWVPDRCVITTKGRAVLHGNTAAARAEEVAAGHKARMAERKPPPPEPVYPRLVVLLIRHFEIEDKCPKCGELAGIDFGHMYSEDIPEKVELGCENCGAEWAFKLSLDALLGER